jgi:hypothetical protein
MPSRRFVVAALGLVAVGLAAVSAASGGRQVVHACAVTLASQRTKPPASVPRSLDYGNATLAVRLYPRGHLIAGRLPGGGSMATVNTNGSIWAKFAWWRADDDARLKISGHRLDAAAPLLTANVPDVYGIGFQPTGMTYPTTGCWRVTGTFKKARLSFTVLVTKSPLGP